MNAGDRREEIIQRVRAQGEMSVETLSEMLGVTASTIRRDLARLTDAGDLARTYGGVIAVSTESESTLDERSLEAPEIKRALGIWCARQVPTGSHVLLDAGSTTAQIARALRETAPLSVVSTGLTSLQQMAGAPDVEFTLLGGRYRSISQGFIGPITEVGLEKFTFDFAFLGADAVTAEDGVCEATPEQVRLKELMSRRATHVHVVAHAAKLGQRPFHAWADLGNGWTLVTDDSAEAEQIRAFEARGITVVTVDGMGVAQPPRD
ncbi:DeoR/GlpR family DNA-binding transcription regulator [Brevibacterium marinum]|uniref:DeoR/GlpR family transcriptional regulator of sugar metabolism n=1 Tax=Brevibacterium marinum TaxID=418643 RepID=A0A846RX70_9MICO|nr:DeoR/GlpR family DNA-binding transcription regulator [Brevibacterium marinum]NJC55223.1 DeoR/GlpR family transcriptional regulator of sugar metabolism [Brevibacterium marinum]